jgi:hypothetical protein
VFFISGLRRQREEELCEFEASLVYIVSSRASRPTQRNPVPKTKKKKKKKKTNKTNKKKNPYHKIRRLVQGKGVLWIYETYSFLSLSLLYPSG